MVRFFLIIFALFSGVATAQQVEWHEQPIERTQTLSFDLAFGEELTLIAKIRAADFEMRALATHSQELVDGTVMAAILRTQPSVRIANSGGAFKQWTTDVRQFQKLGVIEDDDFAITVFMPDVEGADFVPNLKLELILRPITPESEIVFLDAAELSDSVLGAADYGLETLQYRTRYPNIDMAQLVFLRDLPGLSLSVVRQGGLCLGPTDVRTMFARLADLTPEGLSDQDAFPQECWTARPDGLRAASLAEDADYQPDLRIRLGENSGDIIGFAYGVAAGEIERIFIQNTSRGWLYSSGDGTWEVVRNGTRVDVPFGDGLLAIRNPRGGETPDATENDAFVSYLVE